MRGTRWLALLMAAVVFACGKPALIPTTPSPTPNPNLTATALFVTGPSTIAPGETAQFTATARMSDGSSQDYTPLAVWRTSNAAVLTISPAGQGTGHVSGEALVTGATSRIGASRGVTVIPQGTYRLTGQVLEADLPVADATVAVVSGQGSGLSAVTDKSGQYGLYGVVGAVQIQVSKAGYISETKSASVTSNEVLDFFGLAQAGAPASVAGAYTLALTGTNCTPSASFPDADRNRTYTAVVTQDGVRLLVTLSGADFVVTNGRGNSFKGRVQPDGVVFQITSDYYYYTGFDVLERLPANQSLAIYGDVTATASPTGISGTLSGGVIIYNSSGPNPYSSGCYGPFQFALTPQGPARVRR